MVLQRELFLSEVNNKTIIAAIEANNDAYCLQKRTEKFPLCLYIFLLREINCFQTTDLVDRAHSQGLEVLVWTFRNEYGYLAWEFNQDPYQELEKFTNMGKTLHVASCNDVIL